MKLVWSQKLYLQDPWKPALEGVFFYQKSGVSFYFKDAGAVKCVCGCTNMPSVLFRPEARQLCIPLPRNWQVVNQVGDNFLMCNEEIAINLMNGVLINPVPDSMLREYRRKRLPDKTLSHLGNIRFTTKANGGISVKKAERISGNSLGAHICTPICSARATICISGQPELAAIFTF